MTDQHYTRLDFARLALLEFPELRAEFDEYPDLLHLQMHALERLAEHAKADRDWMLYRRIMLFADRLWRRSDDELLNALNVSFLEHLEFDGPDGPKAWGYLSSELKDGWRAMDAYMTEVAKRAQPPRKQRPPRPRGRRR